MKRLVCNTDTFCHIDYGVPIIATKSTDYRTSTGKYHSYLPTADLQFTDFRTKANLNRNQLSYDIAIRDDTFQSTYRNSYVYKQTPNGPCDTYPTARYLTKVDYVQPFVDTNFRDATLYRAFKNSEMKDNYTAKEIHHEEPIVGAPERYAKCEIKALGRDEQPPVPPELKGFYRHMDPYVSTNRADFVPHTVDRQNGIARKDIVTFYDASNVPKGGKGYGPKNGVAVDPLMGVTTKLPIYDKAVFNKKFNDRRIPNRASRLPHTGKRTEYGDNYYQRTGRLVQLSRVDYQDSLAAASPWQNLAPPAMYCTDHCHIGTGWPVDAVVEPKKLQEYQKIALNDCVKG